MSEEHDGEMETRGAKVRRLGIVLGLVVLALAPGIAAQAAPAVSEQDKLFLQAAHQSNLAEIAAGQLAERKGASQQVRDLGARFVADHTRLDQAIQATASALGVTLPSTPKPEQQGVQRQLEASSGSQFDTAFITTQLDSHKQAMRSGETELAQGSDPSAKKVAQDAAPVIAAHHEALQNAARDLNVPSRIDSGAGGQPGRMSRSAVAVLVGAALVAIIAAVLYARRRRSARR